MTVVCRIAEDPASINIHNPTSRQGGCLPKDFHVEELEEPKIVSFVTCSLLMADTCCKRGATIDIIYCQRKIYRLEQPSQPDKLNPRNGQFIRYRIPPSRKISRAEKIKK
jgi:hypothetical protein